jgi:hypothetical protein
MSEQNDSITILGGNVTEATPADYEDFWGYEPEVFGSWNYNLSPDTISFSTSYTGSRVVGGLKDDTFTFTPAKNNKYKYSEDAILKELTDYIAGTYNQHYSAGDDKIQTLDLIEACGEGESFCRSNILKYASRYDKKGTARRDILKILHYAVLLMHFNDKNAQRETYPQ